VGEGRAGRRWGVRGGSAAALEFEEAFLHFILSVACHRSCC